MAADLYAGIMSGTSVDAADAVIARFDAHGVSLLGRASLPWPEALRLDILRLAGGCEQELDLAGRLDRQLARHCAASLQQAMTEAGVTAARIRAVGSHGQTVRHRPLGPDGFTWQIGDPNTLAELTGIPVVADFRRRDVAAGGQGAPLVPAFHAALFAEPARTVVVLNLGGIANITVLAPGQPVRGHDTGPANMLLDGWHQRHRGGAYDADGAWAAAHQPDTALLARLLEHPYLQLPAPKSTGREDFGMTWLQAQLAIDGRALEPGVVQATLLAYTVECTRRDVAGLGGGRLLVCGGGACNGALMRALAEALPGWQVETTAAAGLDPLWVEATAFAWLARQTVLGLAGNLPAVTGAQGPRVLGGYYPA